MGSLQRSPTSVDSGLLTYTCILFSFQIYTDFAGYSNMAIGIAKLFDYHLILNFKTPYLSSSVTSFWKKWHISLSNWVKDYIYIQPNGLSIDKDVLLPNPNHPELSRNSRHERADDTNK